MTFPEPDGGRFRFSFLAGLIALLLTLVGCTAGDDDADDDTDVVVVDEEPTPTPSPTEDFELGDPDEVEGDPPAETFEVFNARDPFQQLVDASAGETADGGTTPPDNGTPPPPPGGGPGPGETPPGGTTDPPPPGSTPPSPGTTPPPDDSDGNGGTDGTGGSTGGNGSTDGGNGSTDGNGDGNGSDAQVGGTQVTLVDVFTDDDGERKATVTVNGTGYTVGEGETFGRRFRLLDISGRCATMLFGDSRFTLCEGERIRK